MLVFLWFIWLPQNNTESFDYFNYILSLLTFYSLPALSVLPILSVSLSLSCSHIQWKTNWSKILQLQSRPYLPRPKFVDFSYCKHVKNPYMFNCEKFANDRWKSHLMTWPIWTKYWFFPLLDANLWMLNYTIAWTERQSAKTLP